MARINDADSAACTTAERAFLQALGGGCQVPYAAYATVEGEHLRMLGATFSPGREKCPSSGDRRVEK